MKVLLSLKIRPLNDLSIMTENYETHLTSLYKTHCDVIELNSTHSIWK